MAIMLHSSEQITRAQYERFSLPNPQLAHAAVRTKETYLSAFHHRLAARRGTKRAIMAVAHSIVMSAFHMLTRNEPYRELGATYFDEQRREHIVDRLAQRIERLGYEVHLKLGPTAA
jgi:hypothetical protein